MREAWATGTPVLGRPTIVGSVALAYTSPGENELDLRAWDTKTGEERWAVEATPGQLSDWVLTPDLFDADGRTIVAVVQPATGYEERMVLVDVETGEELAYPGDETTFVSTSRPGDCVLDESGVGAAATCLTAFTEDSGDADVYLRISPAEGLVAVPAVGQAAGLPNAYELLAGLWLSWENDADLGTLTYVADGARRWQLPYEQVFGAGYTADDGGTWDIDADAGVFVGTGYSADLEPAGSVTVGIDAASGTVLWTAESTEACWPGMYRPDVLCSVNRGRPVLGRQEVSLPVGSADRGAVDVVDVDIATGSREWTVSLTGAETALFLDEQSTMFTGNEERMVVVDDGAPLLLDLTTGEIESVEHWPAFACTQSVSFSYHEWGDPNEDPIDYYGGFVHALCDATGMVTRSAGVSAQILDLVAEPAESVYVLALPDGLHGYWVE